MPFFNPSQTLVPKIITESPITTRSSQKPYSSPKSRAIQAEIIGVQSTEAPSYALSFAAGHVVETNSANTRADGMATRQPDAEALAIIRAGASRVVTVSDDEVAEAIRAYWTDTHNLAEGAGAAPLAALLQERARWAGKRVGVVLCGGNIDLALFRSWVLGINNT